MNNLKNLFALLLLLPFLIYFKIKQYLRFVLKKQNSKRIVNAFVFYWVVCFLLFLFGPIKYPIVNITFPTILFILYIISFKAGNQFASLFRIEKTHSAKFYMYNNTWNNIITIGLFLGILFNIFTIALNIGSFSITETLNNIMRGLSDPSQGYNENLLREYDGGIITQMTTLFSPLVYIALILSIYFWKYITRIKKFYVLTYVVLEASQYIIRGTNFGLFRIAIIIVTTLAILKNEKTNNLAKKNLLTNISPFIVVFVIFYFFFSISSRMNYTSMPGTLFGIPVDSNNYLLKFLPINLATSVLLGISYLSQGFYGFQLATMYEFTSTYGFGAGRFLMTFPQRLFDIDLWEKTYQSKMDSIWDSRINWHTAFTWLANDWGFIGVAIYMFLTGLLFTLIIKDVKNKNPFAIVIVPIYIIMFIFMPLNNIVYDNPQLLMPFLFFVVLWILDKIFSSKEG